MTVFLRWGIFGLLAVAALLYAYNASKRLSSRGNDQPQGSVLAPASPDDVPAPPVDSYVNAPVHVGRSAPEITLEEMPSKCVTELLVAQQALTARREGEPLDRVLRSQRVAFEENESRRRRLEDLAREYFDKGAPDPDSPELRRLIMRRCR